MESQNTIKCEQKQRSEAILEKLGERDKNRRMKTKYADAGNGNGTSW